MVASIQFIDHGTGNGLQMLFVGEPYLLAMDPACCCGVSAGNCIWVTGIRSAGGTLDPDEEPDETDDYPPFPTDGTDARFVWHGHALDNVDDPPGQNGHNHGWIIEMCTDDPQKIVDYLAELATWESDHEADNAPYGHWDDVTIGDAGPCHENDEGDFDDLVDYVRGLINTTGHSTTPDEEEDLLGPIQPGGFCV